MADCQMWTDCNLAASASPDSFSLVRKYQTFLTAAIQKVESVTWYFRGSASDGCPETAFRRYQSGLKRRSPWISFIVSCTIRKATTWALSIRWRPSLKASTPKLHTGATTHERNTPIQKMEGLHPLHGSVGASDLPGTNLRSFPGWSPGDRGHCHPSRRSDRDG